MLSNTTIDQAALMSGTHLLSCLLAGHSSFALTSISGGKHCRTTQLAAMWSTLYIEMSEDCNYTFSGNGGSYIMPVTFAKVSYPTRSGTRQPYIVLQDTSKEPSSSAWGSNTWRYFNITKDKNG
jgi:hypothetical protein